MIVEAMTRAELTREVMKDFEKLRDTTELRLVEQYDKERRKFKIDRQRTYSKMYPIKTGSKNTWLIFISKKPAAEKYNDGDTVSVSYVVYFYTSRGLSVINVSPTGFLDMYYAHFFKRYNERMNLGLSRPLDVLQHYFINGCNVVYSIVNKGDAKNTIGISPEGILLRASGRPAMGSK